MASAVVAAAIGCSTISPTVRQSFTQSGLDRAAFEMKCPKENLELVQLNRPLDDRNEFDTQVGVRGCGSQVVYVDVRGAGWVANTAK
jgi:hypothetical protein